MTRLSDEEKDPEEKGGKFKLIVKKLCFYVIFVLVIIIDFCIFPCFHDWGSSISILVLELLLLLNLARDFDIAYLEVLTDRILNYTNSKGE